MKSAKISQARVLLFSCALSAGLAVYLTSGDDVASSANHSREVVPPDGPSPGKKLPAVLRTRGSEGHEDTTLGFGPAMQMSRSDDELKAMEVPSQDEAVALRKPKVDARSDILEEGILALIDPALQCSEAEERIETALAGYGVYACAQVEPDGLVSIVGRAVHRKRNGNLEVGEYDEGRRVGVWEQYYPTGILAARGEFVDDQRHGTWDEFDETGAHQVSRTYELGRKQGLTLSYGEKTPRIELWSSLGQLDLKTRQPVPHAETVETL